MHRYLYAYQNPTVYVDPTGAWPTLDESLAFGKALVKGAAIAAGAVAVVAAVAAASPVIAIVGTVGAIGTLATMAVTNRYEQAAASEIEMIVGSEDYVPQAILSDAVKLGVSDTIGLTAVVEGWDGTEVGTGRQLSGVESADRLGTVIGAYAGGAAAARGVSAISQAGDDIARIVAEEFQAGAREAVGGVPVSPPRPATGIVVDNSAAPGAIIAAREIAAAPRPPPRALIGPATADYRDSPPLKR